MMRVYLSGGFGSGWQDDLYEYLVDWWEAGRVSMDQRVVLIDPRGHGLKDERQYTTWDLAAIRESDVVVANIEPDNPGHCRGLMLEIGYARALSKVIVVVDQSGEKYYGMARAVADVVVTTLEAAAKFLLSLAGGTGEAEHAGPHE